MLPTTPAEVEALEARVARLEMLVAAMSAQVVTRKLIVLDDHGRERIIARTWPGGDDAEIAVYATGEHYVALNGSTASCCPSASLAVITAGDVAEVVGPALCVCAVAA